MREHFAPQPDFRTEVCKHCNKAIRCNALAEAAHLRAHVRRGHLTERSGYTEGRGFYPIFERAHAE